MTKTHVPHFYRRMLKLAIPIALQNMLASCAALVDTAMVARLGNSAISAVGIGGKWTMLLQMIIFGFGSGGAVLIAQYWGAQEHKNVRRAYSLGAGLCLAAALIYTIVAACFPYQMMSAFSNEESVRLAGVDYLGTVCFGALPLAFAILAGMARRSVEDVRTPLIVSGIAVILNTVLNYCLIYGNFGFPELGLRGAAIATVISHCSQAVMMLAIGLRQKHFTIFGLAEMRHITKAFAGKYFRIALPVVCNETLWGVGFNLFSVIYAHQGSENYAAYTLYSSISDLTFVFFIGACGACSIMVGKTIGQGLFDEAKAIAYKMLGVFVVMGIVLGALLLVFRWPIINMMGVETQYTAQMTADILRFYCFWLPLRNLNYVLVLGILRAGGDTKVSAMLDVGVTLLWAVPVTWFLAYVVRVPFLWMVCGTFIAEDLLKFPLCMYRMHSGKWLRSLTGGEEAAL